MFKGLPYPNQMEGSDKIKEDIESAWEMTGNATLFIQGKEIHYYIGSLFQNTFQEL